jgi:cytoskeleton protein RodZ
MAYGAYRLVVSADEMLTQPVTPAPPQAAVTKKSVEPVVSPPANNTGAPASTAPVTTAGNAATAVNQLPGAAPATPPVTGAVPSSPQPQTVQGGTSGFMQPGGQAVIPPAPQVAPLPPGQVYGAQNRNPRVILRVHVATRILVQGPKKAVFINRTLKPGDTYQVPNMVGLTLTTPNGGAVELDLDGQAMGFAGHEQQMTEALSLDPQSIVDRYNRQ